MTKKRLTNLAQGKRRRNPAARYCTDKADHGYLEVYDRLLPATVSAFMEIGVGTGDSIRMFRDAYHLQAEFHAFDSFGSGVVAEEQLKREGFVTHKGSQSDIAFLETISDKFDVIVEDGSHHSDEQIITFKHLFLNNMNPGGCYALEDLCCCKEPYWWRCIERFEDTFLAIIKRVMAGGDFTSQLITEAESDRLLAALDHVNLECEDTAVVALMWAK